MKLTSKQIVLRDWQKSDLEIERYWSYPKHLWHKTNGPYYGPRTETQINERISNLDKIITGNNFPELRTSLVIACADTDKLIGSVSWYYQKCFSYSKIYAFLYNKKTRIHFLSDSAF